MPSTRCYNKGCGVTFNTEENRSDACTYHPGEPYFHDAKKQWSCCNKYSTDFSEFLGIKGCAVGPHNPDKPQPLEEPKPKIANDSVPPLKPIFKTPIERSSSNAALVRLIPNVSASLTKSLESLMEGKIVAFDEDDNIAPKKCYNPGCKAVYRGIESDTETCSFHCGVPVFHEGCKFWSCCNRKTTDFESFLAQEGCTVGRHAWTREDAKHNGAIGTPAASQCRFDWFQMSRTVTLTVYAKNVLPNYAEVLCNGVFLSVSLLYNGGKMRFERNFNLYGMVDPSASKLNLTVSKAEIVLQKAEVCSWPALEITTSAPNEEEKEKEADS